MGLNRTKPRRAYGIGDDLLSLSPMPIRSKKAPKTTDFAEIGTIWIDQPNDDVYIITKSAAGEATWINTGGGTGTFNALTVTTTASIGGAVTLGALGLGMVQSSATGLLSSITGTNGQVIIGATAAAPIFATIVSGDGSMSVALGANTLDLRVTGAAASTFPADGGIATPVLGATTLTGGTNLTTAAVGGVVTFNVDDAPTFAGLVTAQAGITQSAGTTTITSDTNGAQAIYLHADGGVNETIEIRADQSTSVQSVYIHSDVGGVDLTSGLAAANSIRLSASDAAGGIVIDAGAGGISVIAIDGAINLESGTGAINVGVDAAAHTVTVGSTNTTAGTVIQSGTGDVTVTSTDAATIDCAGVLELNSSAGIISIGNDAIAQNINLGTGAAARTISIGNATGVTAIDIDAGTGACSILSNATDHSTTFGSVTGVAAMTVQAGTGALTLTAGGILDVNATGAVTVDTAGLIDVSVAGNVTIDSSAGTIGIGEDADAQNINIGTGAAARIITVGNATAATSIVLNAGTGAVELGANGTVHLTTVGSAAGASATTLQAGTGDLILTAGGLCDVNGTGNVTIDSTAGTLGMGEGADAQNINIGTGAAARVITIGNATGATAVDLNTGTAGVTITSGGLLDVTPATDSQATPTAASTMNVNVGVATFTGFSTAAAATQSFTITNALVSATSGVLCSVSNLGANDALLEIQRITPGAGSFVVALINNGSQALNDDVIISFFVLN